MHPSSGARNPESLALARSRDGRVQAKRRTTPSFHGGQRTVLEFSCSCVLLRCRFPRTSGKHGGRRGCTTGVSVSKRAPLPLVGGGLPSLAGSVARCSGGLSRTLSRAPANTDGSTDAGARHLS